MDIDATFKPLVNLIDNVFPTPVVYRRMEQKSYDAATGQVTENVIGTTGILYSSRMEQGGVGEKYEINMYVHGDTSGLPFHPRTGDYIVYDSVYWKIQDVAPSYRSKTHIASKLPFALLTDDPKEALAKVQRMDAGFAKVVVNTQSKLSASSLLMRRWPVVDDREGPA